MDLFISGNPVYDEFMSYCVCSSKRVDPCQCKTILFYSLQKRTVCFYFVFACTINNFPNYNQFVLLYDKYDK